MTAKCGWHGLVRLEGAAAILVVALGLAVWTPWRAGQVSAGRPVALNVNISRGHTLGGEVSPDIAIAPDGALPVFLALDADGSHHLSSTR